jgi:hypothetical protein
MIRIRAAALTTNIQREGLVKPMDKIGTTNVEKKTKNTCILKIGIF